MTTTNHGRNGPPILQTGAPRANGVAPTGHAAHPDADALIDYTLGLPSHQLTPLLVQAQLRQTGTKAQLRAAIEGAVATGRIAYATLVAFVDQVAPWGSQHVFLLDGPVSDISAWRSTTAVRGMLRQARLERVLDATIPVELADSLAIAQVVHTKDRLLITAAERREYMERADSYDVTEEVNDQEVVYKAYVRRVDRGLVVLDWNLAANTAALRITQLPGHQSYEKKREEFYALLATWLPLSTFPTLQLRNAIARLHEAEDAGRPETKSVSRTYTRQSGRNVTASSASQTDPLHGDAVVDTMMTSLRGTSVGRRNSCYWLKAPECGRTGCPLAAEVFTDLVGFHNRINFTAHNDEASVNYVLSRIRALCATPAGHGARGKRR